MGGGGVSQPNHKDQGSAMTLRTQCPGQERAGAGRDVKAAGPPWGCPPEGRAEPRVRESPLPASRV